MSRIIITSIGLCYILLFIVQNIRGQSFTTEYKYFTILVFTWDVTNSVKWYWKLNFSIFNVFNNFHMLLFNVLGTHGEYSLAFKSRKLLVNILLIVAKIFPDRCQKICFQSLQIIFCDVFWIFSVLSDSCRLILLSHLILSYLILFSRSVTFCNLN